MSVDAVLDRAPNVRDVVEVSPIPEAKLSVDEMVTDADWEMIHQYLTLSGSNHDFEIGFLKLTLPSRFPQFQQGIVEEKKHVIRPFRKKIHCGEILRIILMLT